MKNFCFGVLIFSSHAIAANVYQAQCVVSEMSSSVRPLRELGTFDLQYPAGVRSSSDTLTLINQTYVTCGFDNRFQPLRFVCSATEANQTFMVGEANAVGQTLRTYGRSENGLKLNFACELKKI